MLEAVLIKERSWNCSFISINFNLGITETWWEDFEILKSNSYNLFRKDIEGKRGGEGTVFQKWCYLFPNYWQLLIPKHSLASISKWIKYKIRSELAFAMDHSRELSGWLLKHLPIMCHEREVTLTWKTAIWHVRNFMLLVLKHSKNF